MTKNRPNPYASLQPLALDQDETPPGVAQAEVRAVSVKAAAALLSISEDEMWEMIRSGRPEVVRRGRRVLVPVEEIDAYIAENKGPWSPIKGAA